MSEIFTTGTAGEQAAAAFFRDRGHDVKRSDVKTFDLLVDDRYVEVKSSRGPYEKLGFIGLTDSQFSKLKAESDFLIVLVCNLSQPDALDIRYFPASALLEDQPKPETTYYWYRSSLDRAQARAAAT